MSKIIILAAAILSPFFAFAVSVNQNVGAEIVTPLVMSQVRELNFGKVEIPSSGTNLIRVSRNGDYHSTTTGAVGNFQESARFEIFGEPNTVVQYSEVSVESTIPGVTFDRLYYPATQTIPGDGQRFVNIGGRIYIDSTASAGIYNNGELTYTVRIEYQ